MKISEKEEKFYMERKRFFKFLEYLNNKYSDLFNIPDHNLFLSPYFMKGGDLGSLMDNFENKIEKEDYNKIQSWEDWANRNSKEVKDNYDAYCAKLEEEGEDIPDEIDHISYFEMKPVDGQEEE